MQHKVLIPIICTFFCACAHNPNKAEKISTNLDHSAVVSGTEKIGTKDGDMVVMEKSAMSEKLRDLQNQVYALEDHVYGTRKLGTLGQYGELKTCMRKFASKQYGGTGELTWNEPLDRITDKEEDYKIGLDEQDKLTGVTTEFLRDRIQRFQGYKQVLQKRSDEFANRIDACKAQLAAKPLNSAESSKVLVNEVPKSSTDRAAILKFMCEYVKSGASLSSFFLGALGKGWFALSDFEMSQNLVGGKLKDAKGVERANGLLFNGWKLAFDTSPVTVGELLAQSKDAKLQAWTFDHKAEVADASKCLSENDGVWNP